MIHPFSAFKRLYHYIKLVSIWCWFSINIHRGVREKHILITHAWPILQNLMKTIILRMP